MTIMSKRYLLVLLLFLPYITKAGEEVVHKTVMSINSSGIVRGIAPEPEGIIATISNGGYAKIKLRLISSSGSVYNTPIYMCQSTRTSSSDEDYVADEITGEDVSFSYSLNGLTIHVNSGKDIRGRLQSIVPIKSSGSENLSSSNFPNTLMNDVYATGFSLALIPTSNYVLDTDQNFYSNMQRFELEITTKDAKIEKIAVPGIGIMRLFNASHPCSTIVDIDDEVCDCLQTMKTVENRHTSDIMIAAHRGSWGNGSNTEPPENSAVAIRNAKLDGVDIVEVDIMMSKNKKLLCLHDYNLERLTNQTAASYIFDKTYEDVKELKLRNRNGQISNENVLGFEELLDIVKEQKLVLMVDIKEWLARMKNGSCVANCDYQSVGKQKESWFEILSLCCAAIQRKDAFKHVIIKTYYPPEEILQRIDASHSGKLLITPMLLSNNFGNNIQSICQRIDDWISKGADLVAYFETDFFNSNDVQLKEFMRNGKNYVNILEYLYHKGYRGGIFSEEPVGRKGVVNRWAEWKMKNSEQDVRANYIYLMQIPYGDKMVITTDRIDIWKQIIKIQN